MGTNSSSLNPSESSRCQSVIDGPVLPTAPLHSMPTPMASPQHRVASQADEISHLPVDHATLLDSPLHHLLASEISTDPYAFLDMSFPTRSIEDVLSEDGTDLEQYADGFILGGCCDTGALLGMTDEAIQHLLLVDLASTFQPARSWLTSWTADSASVAVDKRVPHLSSLCPSRLASSQRRAWVPTRFPFALAFPLALRRTHRPPHPSIARLALVNPRRSPDRGRDFAAEYPPAGPHRAGGAGRGGRRLDGP